MADKSIPARAMPKIRQHSEAFVETSCTELRFIRHARKVFVPGAGGRRKIRRNVVRSPPGERCFHRLKKRI
jgi:hypothetical protein